VAAVVVIATQIAAFVVPSPRAMHDEVEEGKRGAVNWDPSSAARSRAPRCCARLPPIIFVFLFPLAAPTAYVHRQRH